METTKLHVQPVDSNFVLQNYRLMAILYYYYYLGLFISISKGFLLLFQEVWTQGGVDAA